MAFWRRVSISAGKSEHALRQMCSAYEFVRTHPPHLPSEFVDLALRRPYTHLELIARIAETDVERAIELIFSPGNIQSVRDLRKALHDVRTKHAHDKSALVEGHQTRNDALMLVAKRLPNIVDPLSTSFRFRKWPGTMATVSPSLVTVRPRTDAAVHVIGVFVVTKANQDALYRGVARSGWESTFFDTYWLAVPAVVVSEADILVRQFGLSNVGLVMFDVAKSEVTLAHEPTEPRPVPDRRSLLHLPDHYLS